ITLHLALNDFSEMRFDALGGDEAFDQRVIALLVGNDGNIRCIALISGAGMGDVAKLHLHASTKCTCGRTSSSAMSAEATPMIFSRSRTISSASRPRALAPGPAYEICPSPT